MPTGVTDYDDFGGGIFRVTHHQVEATNGAGEATSLNVGAPILVVQEDGTNAGFDAPTRGSGDGG